VIYPDKDTHLPTCVHPTCRGLLCIDCHVGGADNRLTCSTHNGGTVCYALDEGHTVHERSALAGLTQAMRRLDPTLTLRTAWLAHMDADTVAMLPESAHGDTEEQVWVYFNRFGDVGVHGALSMRAPLVRKHLPAAPLTWTAPTAGASQRDACVSASEVDWHALTED
jgi:hypothetical protein